MALIPLKSDRDSIDNILALSLCESRGVNEIESIGVRFENPITETTQHSRFLSMIHSVFVSPMFVVDQYVDHQLQRGGRGISEEELEKTLDGVMNILRFVEGKDVFQAFYKKDLAKRLLLNTSSSYEAEKVSWYMILTVVTCYIL